MIPSIPGAFLLKLYIVCFISSCENATSSLVFNGSSAYFLMFYGAKFLPLYLLQRDCLTLLSLYLVCSSFLTHPVFEVVIILFACVLPVASLYTCDQGFMEAATLHNSSHEFCFFPLDSRLIRSLRLKIFFSFYFLSAPRRF